MFLNIFNAFLLLFLVCGFDGNAEKINFYGVEVEKESMTYRHLLQPSEVQQESPFLRKVLPVVQEYQHYISSEISEIEKIRTPEDDVFKRAKSKAGEFTEEEESKFLLDIAEWKHFEVKEEKLKKLQEKLSTFIPDMIKFTQFLEANPDEFEILSFSQLPAKFEKMDSSLILKRVKIYLTLGEHEKLFNFINEKIEEATFPDINRFSTHQWEPLGKQLKSFGIDPQELKSKLIQHTYDLKEGLMAGKLIEEIVIPWVGTLRTIQSHSKELQDRRAQNPNRTIH